MFRDDIYPYLGGGNKARKMMALDNRIKQEGYGAIVTTGGVQSNHCRATALYSKKNNIKCTLVLHGDRERLYSESGNAKIIRESGAKLVICNPSEISGIMDTEMQGYKEHGLKPFYLYGGGHTLEGGGTYIQEIEKLVKADFVPDIIFLASGSGTTQAGILAGITKMNLDTRVVGISVGRSSLRAQQVVEDFYQQICSEYNITGKNEKVVVDDTFLCGGYEKYIQEIKLIADESLMNFGFALDTTYTAKAYYGMLQTIKRDYIKGKILFWYTGGIYNYLAK